MKMCKPFQRICVFFLWYTHSSFRVAQFLHSVPAQWVLHSPGYVLGVVTVFRQDEPVSTLSTIIHSQLTISYILLNTIGCEVRMPFLQLLCDNMNTFLINSSLEAACDTVGSNYLLLHRGYASEIQQHLHWSSF